MLTARKLSGDIGKLGKYYNGIENYYYRQGLDEYKDKPDYESLGYVSVYGKLCPDFNMVHGNYLSKSGFLNLLAGKNINGIRLTSREHKNHGIDLCFEAPKSVSIAALVTDKNPMITKAHEDAVLETMEEIEMYYSFTQPRPGVEAKSDGLIYAVVKDGYNNFQEPHLHCHCILMNLAKSNNKIMALHMLNIFSHEFNKLWGSVYRIRLAHKLKELGYGLSYDGKGLIRLDCISKDLDAVFSERTKKIIEKMAEGMSHKNAWRSTRNPLKPDTPQRIISEHWGNIRDSVSPSTEKENRINTLKERQDFAEKAIFSVEGQQELKHDRGRSPEIQKWQLAIRRATAKKAITTKEEIITEYIYECMREEKWEYMSYPEVLLRFNTQINSLNILEVDSGYTSWEMAEADREFVDNCSNSISGWYRFDENKARKLLDKFQKTQANNNMKTLSELQYSAALKIITSNTLLTAIQGDAGCGKTTSLKAIANVFRDKGHKLYGISIAGVAARNLERETGIRCETFETYLNKKRDKTDTNRIVIFDETSMLGSRKAARLFKHAKKYNDKIIVVGDVNQLQSPEAGNVFCKLVELAETFGNIAILNENYRQKDVVLREAVDSARKGDMKGCLLVLDKNGDIRELEDYEERHSFIASRYTADTLVITGTRASKRHLDNLIRGRLFLNGALSAEHSKVYSTARVNDDGLNVETKLEIAKGELITFTKNEYNTYDVRNGERAEVLDTYEKSIKVRSEDGRILAINMDIYNYFDYGYAMTTFKAQGQTYDKVIIDADTSIPVSNEMRNQYVNVTRARNSIEIYTDDKEFLIKLSTIKTTKKDTFGAFVSMDNIKEALQRLSRGLNVREHEDAVLVAEESYRKSNEMILPDGKHK